MSTTRAMYTDNGSSQYLPTAYPPRPEQSSEDFKPPYEDDIINSYAASEVPLPMQNHYQYRSSNSPYLSPVERPSYPALAQKPSYGSTRSGPSEVDSSVYDGGGEPDFSLPASKEKQQDTRGFWEKVLPESMACRLYVLTVIIETFIDIAIEADLLISVQQIDDDGDLGSRRLPVYLSIFAFAHLFQLVMAVDAVQARNTLQFFFLTVFNALFLVYAVVQIFEIRQSLPQGTTGAISNIPVKDLTAIIPIVISVAEVAYIALGWKIWREFGWKIYKRLGADRQVKRMYAYYQIFVCLIKFDVFFFIGFSVQLIWLVLNRSNWEWYVTCAALPFSFLLLVDGLLAAKHENKYMMATFMLGCVGAMVYFVYKLRKIVATRESIIGVFKTLCVFAAIAIILLLVTFAFAIIVMRNFGGGLKYHMSKKHSRTQSLRRRGTEHQHRHQSYPLGFNPNRMSID